MTTKEVYGNRMFTLFCTWIENKINIKMAVYKVKCYWLNIKIEISRLLNMGQSAVSLSKVAMTTIQLYNS